MDGDNKIRTHNLQTLAQQLNHEDLTKVKMKR